MLEHVDRPSAERSEGGGGTRYDCVAAVRVADGDTRHAHVELFGGRQSYSVGGRISEGPRRWYGQLSWLHGRPPVAPGTRVVIELDNGRVADAVVDGPEPSGEGIRVRGLGPPPFDVP